ncbi:MAG: hypothetical protein LBT78_06490, partial [Tannerella sp.]|nr:hypothetical protein [Tannerella sp.]
FFTVSISVIYNDVNPEIQKGSATGYAFEATYGVCPARSRAEAGRPESHNSLRPFRAWGIGRNTFHRALPYAIA